MKVKIKLNYLKTYIKKFSFITNNQKILPEDLSTYIEVHKDKIVLLTKNANLKIKCELKNTSNFEIIEEGHILIKTSLIANIILTSSTEYLTLNNIEDKILIIKTDESDFELNLLNNTSFVKEIFEFEQNYSFNLSIREFLMALNSVVPIANERNPRKILESVNLFNNDEGLFFISTDNIRISKIKINKVNKDFNLVLDISFVKELLKIIDEEEGNLNISFSDNKISINYGEILIQSKLIQGRYPNILNAFPTTFTKKLIISRENILKLISKASIINSKTHIDNKISTLMINNGVLEMEIREIEIGYANIKSKDFTFEGSDIFKISFNPSLFLSGIKIFSTTSSLEILFNDSSDPIVIKERNNNSKEFLLLPLRV